MVQANANCLEDTYQRCLQITCMVSLCCSEASCVVARPAAMLSINETGCLINHVVDVFADV
jgi:hypothetical protein